MTLDGSLGDMEFFGDLLVRQSDDTAQPEHLAPLRGHSLHFIGDHPLEILHVIGILRLGMNLSDIFKHIEMQRTFIICLGPEIVRNFMTCQEIDECVEIVMGELNNQTEKVERIYQIAESRMREEYNSIK